jgi:HAD superfamily hydrolase (TIGR01509 family)
MKTVLFDCDGLMFDTERVAIVRWTEEAEKNGIHLPDDFFTHTTGVRDDEADAYMRSIPGFERIVDRLKQERFDGSYWQSFPRGSLNKKGLKELFQWLDEHHMARAVCSSSPLSYVKALIDSAGFEMHIDVFATGDMVKHAKPNPEVFLIAARELGCQPADCLVLEDSKAGIIAAKRAGMHSCWIKDMIDADEEMKEALDYTGNSLLDVIPLLEQDRGD